MILRKEQDNGPIFKTSKDTFSENEQNPFHISNEVRADEISIFIFFDFFPQCVASEQVNDFSSIELHMPN